MYRQSKRERKETGEDDDGIGRKEGKEVTVAEAEVDEDDKDKYC